MDKEQFSELMKKLDKILFVIAKSSMSTLESNTDKILFLSSLGFKPSEIAQMVGTTPNSVRATLSKAQKKKKKKPSKAGE